MIRDYILKTFVQEKIEANPQVIGNEISEYLTDIYRVYSYLMKKVFSKIKTKNIPSNVAQQVDSIILNGLLNYTETQSPTQMMSALRRMELEYKTRSEGTVPKVEVSRLRHSLTILSYIGTIISTIVAIYKITSMIYARNKGIKTLAKTNAQMKRLFDYFIIPPLKNMYMEMKERKIKSDRVLKLRFFKIIDKVSKVSPEVAPYLAAWGG